MNTDHKPTENRTVHFYPVRYYWSENGATQQAGTVAMGATPEEALQRFQSQHRHVKAELVASESN